MSGLMIGLTVWAVVISLVWAVYYYQQRKWKVSKAFEQHQLELRIKELHELAARHERSGLKKGGNENGKI